MSSWAPPPPTPSWAGDANHFGSTGTATFEITKAASTVTVTCPAAQVYTGSAIAPCTAEATGAGMSAVDVSASLAYTDNVIVGTATADASWAGDANHFGSTGTATFEITKAASTVTVTCPAARSTPVRRLHPAPPKPPARVERRRCERFTRLHRQCHRGHRHRRCKLGGRRQPLWQHRHRDLRDHQAASTVTVTCPAAQVYTGSAIAPCTAEATGAGMSAVDVSASLAYTDNVIVGTATADASWAGDANHFGSTGTATFEITKATLTVTADPQTKVYGQLNPTLTFVYSGFLGTDDATVLDTKPTCATTASQYSNVGPYPITCSGAGQQLCLQLLRQHPDHHEGQHDNQRSRQARHVWRPQRDTHASDAANNPIDCNGQRRHRHIRGEAGQHDACHTFTGDCLCRRGERKPNARPEFRDGNL